MKTEPGPMVISLQLSLHIAATNKTTMMLKSLKPGKIRAPVRQEKGEDLQQEVTTTQVKDAIDCHTSDIHDKATKVRITTSFVCLQKSRIRDK
jgi:hypothetical protein